MQKKRQQQAGKARAKAGAKPPKPSKAQVKAGGGGGADAKRAAEMNMDLASEKNSALDLELPSEKVERLQSELPEGYRIVGPADEVFFMGELTEAEPEAGTEKQKSEPSVPWHYYFGHVVFEADRLRASDGRTARQKQNDSLCMPLNFIEPAMSQSQVREVQKKVREDFDKLKNLAQHSNYESVRNAAGRAVASIVAGVLDAWPTDKNYKICVIDTIRKLKRNNVGFKQRWDKELHRRGVPRERKGIDWQLQLFVEAAEFRLSLLVREVIHAALGGEPPIAKREAKCLGEWMAELPPVKRKLTEAKCKPNAYLEIQEAEALVEQAKLADVPRYFQKVFRPAIEPGYWRKRKGLPGVKFGEQAGKMETMLKQYLFEQAD